MSVRVTLHFASFGQKVLARDAVTTTFLQLEKMINPRLREIFHSYLTFMRHHLNLPAVSPLMKAELRAVKASVLRAMREGQ